MLKVSNRFAPMRAQNTSVNQVENKSQDVNFAGNKLSKKVVMGGIIGLFAVGAVTVWGGVISSKAKNDGLKKQISLLVSKDQFDQISHKSDSIAINKPSFPFWYAKANKYLTDVKKALVVKK